MSDTDDNPRELKPTITWRNAGDYGADLTMPQWAWEFLRRNPDYLRDWQRWQQLEPPSQIEPIQPAAMRDFLQNLEWERVFRGKANTARLIQATREADKWGLICPIDPAMTPTQGEDFWFWKRKHHREDVFVLNKTLAEYTLPNSPPEEIYVALDLSRPKGAQMKRAGELFKEEQDRQGVSVRDPKTKSRLQKYPNYLRVLDAKALGVAPIEIRDVLWPAGGAPNIYEFAEQAERLRDGGYVNLIPL